jgi:hypothetical protein
MYVNQSNGYMLALEISRARVKRDTYIVLVGKPEGKQARGIVVA